MGYQLTSIIAGGPAPIIATALLATYNTGYAVAFYVAFCAIVSFLSTLVLRDSTNKSIQSDQDYA